MQFNSSMTPEERYAEANKYDRLKKLQEEITEQIVELNKLATGTVNGNLGAVYELNYNGIVEQVSEVLSKVNLKDSKSSAKETISPFQTIAIDKLKDKRQVESNVANQLVTAIVQGASLGALFGSVKNVIEQNLNSTQTIAINAFTRTESVARNDAVQEARKFYPVKKQWVAVMDSRTRDAHREANGQIVDIDKPFIVGGEKLQYPADVAGSLKNIINCRCTTRFIFDKDTKK